MVWVSFFKSYVKNNDSPCRFPPITVSEKTIFPSSNCHIHKNNIPQNTTTACRQNRPVLCIHQGLFILNCFIPCHWSFLQTHLPCFVIEWVWWDQNSLLTYQHNSILFMQNTLKWKTNKETKLILFVNCSCLAPDTTMKVSVHQVFEEKAFLNFIYQFSHQRLSLQFPYLTIAKSLEFCRVFFPKSSNTSQHVPALQTIL